MNFNTNINQTNQERIHPNPPTTEVDQMNQMDQANITSDATNTNTTTTSTTTSTRRNSIPAIVPTSSSNVIAEIIPSDYPIPLSTNHTQVKVIPPFTTSRPQSPIQSSLRKRTRGDALLEYVHV